MSGRIRGSSGHRRIPLSAGWEFCAAPAGPAAHIEGGANGAAIGLRRRFPGPRPRIFATMDNGALDSAARRFDAEVWWYRTRFKADACAAGERVVLCFDGLATLAEVWLNGEALLISDNMFLQHRCDVGAILAAENELIIRFSPIDAALAVRRPRARWRTPMVAHQQLRWIRTTLLGRTPGWSPPAPPWVRGGRCGWSVAADWSSPIPGLGPRCRDPAGTVRLTCGLIELPGDPGEVGSTHRGARRCPARGGLESVAGAAAYGGRAVDCPCRSMVAAHARRSGAVSGPRAAVRGQRGGGRRGSSNWIWGTWGFGGSVWTATTAVSP